MRGSTLAVAIVFALAGSGAAQTTTYSYTSAPFTLAVPPYTEGGRITGTITLASPLPAFLPRTDIADSLLALSFTDGVATRTLADSGVCVFEVATDGAGNITHWILTVVQRWSRLGDPQHVIHTTGLRESGLVWNRDRAGVGPMGYFCHPESLGPYASAEAYGSWSDTFDMPSRLTTYRYTGAPYTLANAPYAAGGRVTGTFTTANPLPPFLPLTDIAHTIVSLSFTDGIETRTLGDSGLCWLEVSTDGTGNITRWRMQIVEARKVLAPKHSIEISGPRGFYDVVPGDEGSDVVGRTEPTFGDCFRSLMTTDAATSTEGRWRDDNPLATQPTTYTYTGPPFTTAIPPYAVGGRLTGTITTASPLPPYMPLTDVAKMITGLSFDDGLRVRTLANSDVCVLRVATDGVGNIIEWWVRLSEAPFVPDRPQHAIESEGMPSGFGTDRTGDGLSEKERVCSYGVATEHASTESHGSWTDTNPLRANPATYRYTGAPFAWGRPPHAPGGRVTGVVTTATPLPAFRTMPDIRGLGTSLTFTDGVGTLTETNTTPCPFMVVTDHAGIIVRWDIELYGIGPPGVPASQIESTFYGYGGGDTVGTGVPAYPDCSDRPATWWTAASDSPGTWAAVDAHLSEDVPALGATALLALIALLAVTALIAMRMAGIE